MKKKYDYMIKTINPDFTAYGGFKYPQKKGALVEAPDWNPEPKCGGGIHGTVGWTKKQYIQNNDLWMILKFIKDEAVVIGNDKIKVPRAWVVDWGSAEEMQKKWEELTNYKYEFGYATQTAGDRNTQTAGYGSTQTAGYGSTQTAGDRSTQTAGDWGTQTAGYGSTQTAGDRSTQTAGDRSTQTAGYGSTQTAGDRSTQTAGYGSTQTAGDWGTQTAGDRSTQTAGYRSTQTAGYGSVSIIRGQLGYCKHKGKVLQILCFYDYDEDEYVFLTKIINDTYKHKLTTIKENGEWVLKDEIIKEVKNDNRD